MTKKIFHPGNDYLVDPPLQHALDGAIALGQPLLLTGEPGTGKTTLAEWAVHDLRKRRPEANFHPEVLHFNTKTTSAARDLFYTYDALSHFQASNLKGAAAKTTADFIELQALGRAIAMSNPRPVEYAAVFRTDLPAEPRSSVVLIDEVDKAPRDFTNDILDEIDKKRFSIREQDGFPVSKGDGAEIVIIMTSNSEKNLPDAFLRRCAFYHIEFPQGDRLRDIVERNLPDLVTPATEAALQEVLAFFSDVRARAVRKKPATAELIGWLRLLGLYDYFSGKKSADEKRTLLLHNLSFLVKTQEDLEAVRKLI